MTGKEILIKFCKEHDGEDIYTFIKDLENKSLNYTDSRIFIIDWLDNEQREVEQ